MLSQERSRVISCTFREIHFGHTCNGLVSNEGKIRQNRLCFLQIKGAGTFIRGTGVQLKTGRFVAPYTAIYRFQATLHIGRAKNASLKPRDAVSAMICINSDCEKSV